VAKAAGVAREGNPGLDRAHPAQLSVSAKAGECYAIPQAIPISASRRSPGASREIALGLRIVAD
jgi:hypothetical protein